MSKITHPKIEQEVLKFWKDKKIFKKSLDKKSPAGDYVFYDGPPFATGTPHYGHIVASIMKDVVPRYWTMKGYHVERKWGWDCHGLPIENMVEKELNLKSKKDIIEKVGVKKFNEKSRSRVLEYTDAWKKTITRLGRWADMENPYKTMDLDYMESIWWVFKELWDKGLIYEDYRSMHICPRCETTLSQSEVSEGYKDIKDISVIVKFELTGEPGTYLLAWTTTPWTLIGNVALAVGEDIDYVKVKAGKENYILAKDQLPNFPNLPNKNAQAIKTKSLINKKYKPLFDYYSKSPKFPQSPKSPIYTVVSANFVTTEEGTGIVHIAPAFGEDDMNLGKEKKLPFIQHVSLDGIFKDEVKDFAGLHVKPAGNPKETDKKIVEHLKKKNLIFAEEEYKHSYPHCWRCETPLLNYATSSYFVNVTKLKPKLRRLAEKINWSPSHIKQGRFGKWLEGARDWSISRQRFWASVIPIWKCNGQMSDVGSQKSEPKNQNSKLKNHKSIDGCGELKVFGSIKDLEKASGQKVTDLHKHTMDKIEFKCKCGGTMSRIPDVLDCWFESGSMPYAQAHYPFKNKKEFKENFPAEFIAEGSDQTRTWFYYLHILSTALFGKPAFKNVIVNGIILASDGKKMAKRLQNYPEPDIIMDKYGSDALRFYLLSSPVMAAENFNFSEDGVKEAYQKVIMLLSNVLSFYQMYAGEQEGMKAGRHEGRKSKHILDRWILAKLDLLISVVSNWMDNYDLVNSVRPIQEFINELSTWYVRRSRDRFKGDEPEDREAAIVTLRKVLLTLSKVMAPFTPFIAEHIHQQLKQSSIQAVKPSVHLEPWPKPNEKLVNKKLISQMDLVRQLASLGLEARAKVKIPVRQPLAKVEVSFPSKSPLSPKSPLLSLLKDELNVMSVKWGKASGKLAVKLDTRLTPELESLGIIRELTRHINNLRKQKGLTIKDRITITYKTKSQKIKSAIEKNKPQLLTDTLADDINEGSVDDGKEVEVKNQSLKLKI